MLDTHTFVFGTPGSGKTRYLKQQITNHYQNTNNRIILFDTCGEYHDLVTECHGTTISVGRTADAIDVFTNEHHNESNWTYYVSILIQSLLHTLVQRPLSPNEIELLDQTVIQSLSTNPSAASLLDDLSNALKNQTSLQAFYQVNERVWFTGRSAVNSKLRIKTFEDLQNEKLICIDITRIPPQFIWTAMTISLAIIRRLLDGNKREAQFTDVFLDVDAVHLVTWCDLLVHRLLMTSEGLCRFYFVAESFCKIKDAHTAILDYCSDIQVFSLPDQDWAPFEKHYKISDAGVAKVTLHKDKTNITLHTC